MVMQVMTARSGRAAAHSQRRWVGQSGEIHHLVDVTTRRTLCGRDASGWISVDMEPAAAAASAYCCATCATKAPTQ